MDVLEGCRVPDSKEAAGKRFQSGILHLPTVTVGK